MKKLSFLDRYLDVSYSCCVSGASSINDLHHMLEQSGFAQIEIKPKDESKSFIKEWLPGVSIEKYIVSSIIQAVK
jgi:hypothetical protein